MGAASWGLGRWRPRAVWPSPPFRPHASLPRCCGTYRTFCQEAPGDKDPALAKVGEDPRGNAFQFPCDGDLGETQVSEAQVLSALRSQGSDSLCTLTVP